MGGILSANLVTKFSSPPGGGAEEGSPSGAQQEINKRKRIRGRNNALLSWPRYTILADLSIGWRPTPEKNIETMPCWGENSPEICLVDLGRDTRTSTQSRRLVRRKGATWSLNWPSGANSLAHLQLKCIPYVPL